MKLTPEKIKVVMVTNFKIERKEIKIMKFGDTYTVKSRYHGVNADVSANDPNWEKSLVNHVSWQSPHLNN